MDAIKTYVMNIPIPVLHSRHSESVNETMTMIMNFSAGESRESAWFGRLKRGMGLITCLHLEIIARPAPTCPHSIYMI